MDINRPILIIDDDTDDQEIITDGFKRIDIPNPLLSFSSGEEVLKYLLTTSDKPFLIICDINMPAMSGIQLRKQINENEMLRKKSIPFVFYTTSATSKAIDEAYEMSVQGFFVKEHSLDDMKRLFRCIYDYWKYSRHPND